jgi:diacylglycerol kinase family enzyme
VRIVLAANRAAGGGLDPAALARAMPADVLIVEPQELQRAVDWAPDRLAVAGGDGTIGAVAALAGWLEVPLAVIPAGTANDFARAHGLPRDPLRAAYLAATGTALRPLELGYLADGTPFVNAASAGLAPAAARHAEPLKRLGPAAYAAGALRAALTAAPLPARVTIDGQERFAGRAWQVIVACTGAFGGGSGVGAADPADGVLDVVVVPAGSRASLVRRAYGMRTWTLERQRGVLHVRGAVVEVELPPDTEVNCDGERRHGGLERVTARAGAYSLVAPG